MTPSQLDKFQYALRVCDRPFDNGLRFGEMDGPNNPFIIWSDPRPTTRIGREWDALEERPNMNDIGWFVADDLSHQEHRYATDGA